MTGAPLNPLMAHITAPPIPLIQRAARDYGETHGPVIDLSQAVPGFSAHPDLLRWLGEAAASPQMLGYGPIQGESVLRSAYATALCNFYGAPVAADEIHVTAGANQAFAAAALAVAGTGEAVALMRPYYFNHDTTLAMFGIRTVAIDTDAANGFLPRLDDVAAAIGEGVKAVAIVSPNNPTGAIYPPALLESLFDLCVAKNVWLIVDETYRDFLPVSAGAPHGIFSRANWRDHFIGLYSFSKSFCIPGHRLGAVTAGAPFIATLAKIMDNLQICAPRAPQAAIAKAIPALDRWQLSNRQEIAARADAFRAMVNAVDGWETAALGAYFAYVRHPFATQDATAVGARLAAEFGVIALPGPFFGAGQERYLRMAFANVEADVFPSLADRLSAMLKSRTA